MVTSCLFAGTLRGQGVLSAHSKRLADWVISPTHFLDDTQGLVLAGNPCLAPPPKYIYFLSTAQKKKVIVLAYRLVHLAGCGWLGVTAGLLLAVSRCDLIAPCSAAQAFSVMLDNFVTVARSACSTVPRSCILPHRLPRVSTDTGKTNSPYQSTVLFQEPRQILLYNRTS